MHSRNNNTHNPKYHVMADRPDYHPKYTRKEIPDNMQTFSVLDRRYSSFTKSVYVLTMIFLVTYILYLWIKYFSS